MSLYGWGGVAVMVTTGTGNSKVSRGACDVSVLGEVQFEALVVILVCISERHSNILLH